MKNMNLNDDQKKRIFLAMRDIFYGGEFYDWLMEQEMPMAAAKEYDEAREYFEAITGFKFPEE